jgi:hypothetical protein
VDSRVLDVDHETGITTIHHFDPLTELSHLESVQDIEDITDINKALANEAVPHGQELRRVASIPLILVYELKRKGIWGNQERMRKWLNDRDNRVFRTTLEKV